MITLYATFEVYLPRFENMKGSAIIKQETQLLPMDSAMRSRLESFRMLHKIRRIPLVTPATDERPPRSLKIIRDWAEKNVEIGHVTMTTPNCGIVRHRKANTSRGQQNLEVSI